MVRSERMDQNEERQNAETRKPRAIPTASVVRRDGRLVELTYDPEARQTRFVVGDDTGWRFENTVAADDGKQLIPYRADNSVITNDVVLLPVAPTEYGTERELLHDIQSYIHRYVDVATGFEQIAAHYVAFTWLYDCFQELPYLRLLGSYGTGKTRFLLIVGSICRFPIFASGASTIAPIYYLLHNFRGTLILDEADFRFSDERADIVKILNNGNVKGFPVLRMEVTKQHEFNPRPFQVFGPKIVATRGYYNDRALESRFITEEMRQGQPRADIPINLPPSYKDEALHLRNKLLLYRLRNFGKKGVTEAFQDRDIEPRLRQILTPLLSVTDDVDVQANLKKLARQYHQDMAFDRSLEPEARIVEIIQACAEAEGVTSISIKEITTIFRERHGDEFERPITNKWIGTIIRKKLRLSTYKSDGIFRVSLPDAETLRELYKRYHIESSSPAP